MAKRRKHMLPRSAASPKEQSGVTSVEYALIAALIAMAILVGVQLYATRLGELFDHIAQCVVNRGCS